MDQFVCCIILHVRHMLVLPPYAATYLTPIVGTLLASCKAPLEPLQAFRFSNLAVDLFAVTHSDGGLASHVESYYCFFSFLLRLFRVNGKGYVVSATPANQPCVGEFAVQVFHLIKTVNL